MYIQNCQKASSGALKAMLEPSDKSSPLSLFVRCGALHHAAGSL